MVARFGTADWTAVWDVVTTWDWNTIWTAVGALATAAAAYLIYLAGKQLRFEAWLKAQEVFVEGQFTQARTRLFRHLQETDSTWSPTDEEDGLLVCRRLDEICRLAPYFAFTKAGGENVILDAWDEPIGNSWGLLEPLLTAEREKVNSMKKWEGFRSLGCKAVDRLSSAQRDRLQATATRLSPQVRQLLLKAPNTSLPPAGAA